MRRCCRRRSATRACSSSRRTASRGGSSASDAEQKLESIDPAGDADGLTRQALKTIADLAEDAGHPIETPEIDTSAAGRRPYREAIAVHAQPQASAVRPVTAVTTADTSDDGGGTSWLLFVIPLALVAVVLVASEPPQSAVGKGPAADHRWSSVHSLRAETVQPAGTSVGPGVATAHPVTTRRTDAAYTTQGDQNDSTQHSGSTRSDRSGGRRSSGGHRVGRRHRLQ